MQELTDASKNGDTSHVTCDTLQVEGGEPSFKISYPYFLRFGSEGVLKIFPQRMTDSLTDSGNDKGVCRTAPPTPGLLNIYTP